MLPESKRWRFVFVCDHEKFQYKVDFEWDYEQGRIVDIEGNWYEENLGQAMTEGWIIITREMAERSRIPLCLMVEILSYNI